jgi:hypothetical protein
MDTKPIKLRENHPEGNSRAENLPTVIRIAGVASGRPLWFAAR